MSRDLSVALAELRSALLRLQVALKRSSGVRPLIIRLRIYCIVRLLDRMERRR